MTNMRWLFFAVFADGSQYEQDAADVSRTGAGSAFSDIVPRLDDVISFGLRSQDGRLVVLDLRTGVFHFDGLPVGAGDPDVAVPPGSRRQLIYFRRNFRTRENDVRCVGHDEQGAPVWQVVGQREVHQVEFHLGWKVAIGGRAHKVTVAVR